MKMKVAVHCLAILTLMSTSAFAGTAYYGSCADEVKVVTNDTDGERTFTYMEGGGLSVLSPDGAGWNYYPTTPENVRQVVSAGGTTDVVFEATFWNCADSAATPRIQFTGSGVNAFWEVNWDDGEMWVEDRTKDPWAYLPGPTSSDPRVTLNAEALAGGPVAVRISKTDATTLDFSYDQTDSGTFTSVGTVTIPDVDLSMRFVEYSGEDIVVSNVKLSGPGIVDTNAAPPESDDVTCGSGECVVPAVPSIKPSSAFAIDGKNFSLTAPSGAIDGYVWQKNGGAALPTTTAVLEFAPITAADAGTYMVTYDDGEAAKVEIVLTIGVDVLPAGNELPLSGLLGLGLLTGACALGGTSILRRKK